MMIDFSHPLLGASRRLARTIPFRPHRLELDQPTIAFTFDDFPVSAAEQAAPVLEAHEARGTFYFSNQLAGRSENGQPIASCAVAADLARRGHEIGGHTSGHLNVQRVSPDILLADVATNSAAIEILSGQRPTTFAYPFGVVSLRSKHLLAGQYGALRGIQPGINRGWIDLAHLRGQELYDASSTLDDMATLLDELELGGGWLIFYSHDVRHDPTSIGCSPDYFAAVVDLVAERGIRIEPVAVTLSRLKARDAS